MSIYITVDADISGFSRKISGVRRIASVGEKQPLVNNKLQKFINYVGDYVDKRQREKNFYAIDSMNKDGLITIMIQRVTSKQIKIDGRIPSSNGLTTVNISLHREDFYRYKFIISELLFNFETINNLGVDFISNDLRELPISLVHQERLENKIETRHMDFPYFISKNAYFLEMKNAETFFYASLKSIKHNESIFIMCGNIEDFQKDNFDDFVNSKEHTLLVPEKNVDQIQENIKNLDEKVLVNMIDYEELERISRIIYYTCASYDRIIGPEKLFNLSSNKTISKKNTINDTIEKLIEMQNRIVNGGRASDR